MARGVLQITENRISDFYTNRVWKHNPISSLANRWILLSERRGFGYYSTVRDGPDKSFESYSLHAGVVPHVEPAGPPSWLVTPAQGIPQTIVRRSSSEVAVDLSRVFNYLVGRGSVKVRQNGSVVTPTVRAMEKAMPLDGGPYFRLPDPHGLYCELLCYTGAIRVQGDKAIPDSGDPAIQPTGFQASSLLGARLVVGPALV